ncbi:hypothetical protein BDN71DRAFT_1514032 [Pleurotus eryngii]|uniref:C2H2-type domain-containing protein n=1 Tax=Pleurotus eryngii TaxID=5323 RepID=A0A9P6D1F2_PLEER|nr:hypothetical protein BDN71DRAFT_1514032 [Pleurotus eryngii]
MTLDQPPMNTSSASSPVSSPTPKAAPLCLPAPAQPLASPAHFSADYSPSLEFDNTPQPLPTLPSQHVSAANPAISDLTTTSTLSEYGLQIHRHYSTVHCLACLIAWIPSKVAGHLRSHGFTLSNKSEEKLLHVLKTLQVVDKETPLHPKELGPPVEGLATTHGFCCTICNYACVKASMIEKHIGKHKEMASQYGIAYRTGHVQTFFSPTQRHYFEVTAPPPPPSNNSSMLEFYTTNLLPALTATTKVLQPIHHHELPLMVQMTGWHDHLATHLVDRNDIKNLLDLVTVPTRGSGSRLAMLSNIAYEYLHLCGRRITKSSFEIRKMLQKYPMETVHFKPLEDEETTQRYATILAKLANAIIKSIDSSRNKSGYQFPLSTADIANANGLLKHLKEGANKNEQVIALHILVHPFLSHFATVMDSEEPGSKWNRVIECFIALLSVQENGSFKPPSAMTQPLAILKYLCRITCFLHALAQLEDSTKDLES